MSNYEDLRGAAANEEIILPILSMLKKSMDKMKKFDMI